MATFRMFEYLKQQKLIHHPLNNFLGRLLNSHLKKFYPSKNITLSSESEYMYKENSREYWWNVSVKTATKVPHNKPDLMIWDQKAKISSIIEFSFARQKKVNEKLENYGLLVRNLQIMYPEYKFQVAPVVIGATGYVPKCLRIESINI